MTLASAAGFSLAMTVLAATPGPGVIGVVGCSLASGWRRTLYVIAGIVTGDLLYLLFAVFGLTYLARHLGTLFVFVRLGGGAYLIYTGLRGILKRRSSAPEGEGLVPRQKGGSLYLSGLLITLSNPKVILFYCGFLPAFADLSRLIPAEGVFIVLLVVFILGAVMTIYAMLADNMGKRVQSRREKGLIG
ncbi:MAG: LysE family translocator, partial [Spirochaetales bacterium]|nr:LysE family translocator [Spirochaetales bacterium]